MTAAQLQVAVAAAKDAKERKPAKPGERQPAKRRKLPRSVMMELGKKAMDVA